MKLGPEVWTIIGSIVSAILGWFSKGLWGRHVEDAKTKNFLQGEIDKLYAKVNELMRDQLDNTEKLVALSLELHKTQVELHKYKKDMETARATIKRLQTRIRELESDHKK